MLRKKTKLVLLREEAAQLKIELNKILIEIAKKQLDILNTFYDCKKEKCPEEPEHAA